MRDVTPNANKGELTPFEPSWGFFSSLPITDLVPPKTELRMPSSIQYFPRMQPILTAKKNREKQQGQGRGPEVKPAIGKGWTVT